MITSHEATGGETMKRWLLLENEPALRSGDFFPPEDVWPELAHLRKEHERLLAVVGTEQRAYAELRERYETEDVQRSENLKAAFLAGDDPGDDGRETEEYRHTDLEDARLRAEAARDALVVFLTEAIAEVEHKAGIWYADLESRRTQAEANVEEARRLVAEAERMVGEAERLRNWLDRFTGRSALGHVPFAEMGSSAPISDPAPLPPLGGVLVT
jgi:hypothetical protein